MKLVNAKNGHTGGRDTFTSYCANSYIVIDDNGNVVGGFDQLDNVAHPVFGTRCKMWTGHIEGYDVPPMTYLADVRAFVKGL